MRILYQCEDVVGPRMGGPGIRAVELARRLAKGHDVTLVAPGTEGFAVPGVATAPPMAFPELLSQADALVTQGFGFPIRSLLRWKGRLLLDLYDPVQLEQLARFGPDPSADDRVSLGYVRARLRLLMTRADHILCASPLQRALWLGWLGALGRLSPASLRDDPEARRLIAIVPFGVPEVPPVRSGSPLRDAIDGTSSDIVAFWNGGLWDWMDPALAVRAAARAQKRVPGLKLVFLAGQRPGGSAMHSAADAAREAVRELGAEGLVHFVDAWIPYEERGAWMLDADVVVSAHHPTLEAELAFRTRLLDCLWAGVPVVCTAGDTLADEGERSGWAWTAPAGDAERFAEALVAASEPGNHERARSASRHAAGKRTWQRSVEVLRALLEAPAPERQRPFTPGELSGANWPDLGKSLGRKLWRKLRR